MAPDFLIRCLTVSALETADDGTSQHGAHLFPCISLFSKRQRKNIHTLALMGLTLSPPHQPHTKNTDVKKSYYTQF